MSVSQQLVLEMLTKKRRGADLLTDIDATKRKKDSLADILNQSGARVSECHQVPTGAASPNNGIACSPHADSAHCSSRKAIVARYAHGSIADQSSCDKNIQTTTFAYEIISKSIKTEQDLEPASEASTVNDSVVMDLSRSPYYEPVQPKLPSFPKTYSRRFKADYYRTHSWVEYSVLRDAIFCFACRHFSTLLNTAKGGGRERGNIPFIDVGFRKWEKLGRSLPKHAESKRHQFCMVAWTRFEHKRVSTAHEEPVASRLAKDKTQLKHLLKAVCFLGQQGIAFQGTDGSHDSENKGNFIELLEFISANDETGNENMSKRYADFNSPEYQDVMITAVANQVRENICKKASKYFALLVNEIKDHAQKEQLGFLVRFADNDGNVYEKPLGCYHMETLDASSLATAINDSITQAGLDWMNCVAQCYDGGLVMSGYFHGIQTKILEIAPQAIYMHCHAHCLNLALVQTICNIQPVKDFFSTLQSVYTFFSQNVTIHELFLKAQKDHGIQVVELESVTGEGYFFSYAVVQKIKMCFEPIIVVLHALESQQLDKEISCEANGILCKIQNFRFLLILLSIEVLLQKVQSLSEALQTKIFEVLKNCDLIESTRIALLNLRQDLQWTKLVSEARQLAENCGITLDEEPTARALPLKQHLIKCKIMEYFVCNRIEKTSSRNKDSEARTPLSELLKQKVYFSCLDRFVSELDIRFTDNMNILTAVDMFNPKAANFLDYSSALVIVNHYPETAVNRLVLEAQLDTAKGYLADKNVQDIHSIWRHLQHVPVAFSEVLDLLHLVLVLPITPPSNEKFSCLKKVQHYLGNTCGDKQLGDLMVMACEPAEVKQLNLSDVIARFSDVPQASYPL